MMNDLITKIRNSDLKSMNFNLDEIIYIIELEAKNETRRIENEMLNEIIQQLRIEIETLRAENEALKANSKPKIKRKRNVTQPYKEHIYHHNGIELSKSDIIKKHNIDRNMSPTAICMKITRLGYKRIKK